MSAAPRGHALVEMSKRMAVLACLVLAQTWISPASAASISITGPTVPGTNTYDIVFSFSTAEGVAGYGVSVATTGTYTGNFTNPSVPGFSIPIPMSNPPTNGASGTVGSWAAANFGAVAGETVVVGTVEVTVGAGDSVNPVFTTLDGVSDSGGGSISTTLSGITINSVSTTTTTTPASTTTTSTLPPVTLDVPIAATKLVIVDKLATADKAKTVFVAKTPDAAKGPGTDPDTIGATLDVSYTGMSATAGQFVVPAGALSGDAGWKVNKDTVAKFVNKAAPGSPTGAKVAVIKPQKLLKLVGKSLGDTPIAILTAGAPDAGGVDVVYTVTNGGSTVRHCTNFPQDSCAYKSIAADTGAKLVCKNGMPVTCPAAPTCDVFAQDCPSGYGCYPTGEVIETLCATAGSGMQGSSCSFATDCAAGFECAGVCSPSCTYECLAICDVSSPTCPAGTTCSALTGTGIPNFGVCF